MKFRFSKKASVYEERRSTFSKATVDEERRKFRVQSSRFGFAQRKGFAFRVSRLVIKVQGFAEKTKDNLPTGRQEVKR